MGPILFIVLTGLYANPHSQPSSIGKPREPIIVHFSEHRNISLRAPSLRFTMRSTLARSLFGNCVVAIAAGGLHLFSGVLSPALSQDIGKSAPVRALTTVNTVATITNSAPAVRGSLSTHQPTTAAAALSPQTAGILQFATSSAANIRSLFTSAQGNMLAWAVASKRDRLVDWMLLARMNPNGTDSAGLTPLLRAVTSENWSLAARLLEAGADPNAADAHRVTALMIAAASGNIPILQAMIEKGAALDVGDDKGLRALNYAIRARKADVVHILLAAKARVTEPDLFPVAAETRDWNFIGPILERFEKREWDLPARVLLESALKTKQLDQLRMLLSKHRGVVTPEGCKDPLLAYAVIRNDLETVRLLLEAGADPNTVMPGKAEDRLLAFVPFKTLKHDLTDEPGMTLMTIAAGMGHNEMLRLLMSHGAEKNRATRSKFRLIPLYFAAWGGHAECLQTLIDNAPTPDQYRIEVSLTAQQATLYRNNVATFHTEISSGTPEKPTPTGRFVVTDKKRHHTSNLYDAKMPYFMRLSCKDFGMHEGYIPGYPASHGCIRLPGDSARKLFSEVPIGTLVTIR